MTKQYPEGFIPKQYYWHIYVDENNTNHQLPYNRVYVVWTDDLLWGEEFHRLYPHIEPIQIIGAQVYETRRE